MQQKTQTLLGNLNAVLSNLAINKIKAADLPEKISSGELKENYGPVDPVLVENCMKYYEGVDLVVATSLYLDICNTLLSAKESDFSIPNNPHIVLFNKSIALAKIINKYNNSLSN